MCSSDLGDIDCGTPSHYLCVDPQLFEGSFGGTVKRGGVLNSDVGGCGFPAKSQRCKLCGDKCCTA